jgi:hypothetical protein
MSFAMQAWFPQAVGRLGQGSLTQRAMPDVVIGSVVSCLMIALIGTRSLDPCRC